MKRVRPLLLGAALAGVASSASLQAQTAGRPMIVVDERDTMREEATPHGKIGTSTAYRISDAVPGRTMEFRKRVLHPGAEIGAHVIAHDEVYYVLSGTGEVFSGKDRRPLTQGMAAYLFSGEIVGVHQTGKTPLALIVSYPLPTISSPAISR